ncbi:MAG: insulinase family protein [Leptolyngbyaceae cyanobacterium MAG.088]|nr:insulinase family protein [Leptolyngbyaceae cyanobacterium MAG.088]
MKYRQPLRPKLIKRVLAFLTIPLLLLSLSFYTEPAQAKITPKHYTDLTFADLPEIKIPEYQRLELENGLVVYLMEDHELPLVSGRLLVRTGERLEPSEQTGLADIVGEVMRTGGTKKYDSDTLNQILEQRAASVEVGISNASGTASFSALSEDLEEVFGLFSEVLRQPAFAQEKLDLAKTQRKGGIARRNDDPNAIGSREFRKLVYGDTSPYARTQEYRTLANIKQDDLVQFYRSYFHPNCMILGIVGDFDSQAMTALIKAKLGTWPMKQGAVAAAPPDAAQVETGGLFLVDQPQLTQSTVQIGHLGGRLDDPDIFALFVMNEALNSFGGRLFNEVRTRQGLAYSVYAVWSARYDFPGLFVSGGQTRSETTAAFIKAVKTELEKVREAPLTDKEIQRAKDAILNSFVFNFDDPSDTLSRLMRYEYYGYPEDYIFQYQNAVKEMTAAKVHAAAKRHLQPENLVTIVVGNAQKLQTDLESLGQTITPVDVTIPPPVLLESSGANS